MSMNPRMAAIFFVAIWSVYLGQALAADGDKQASGGPGAPGKTDVKLLEDSADPFGAPAGPATKPVVGQSVKASQVKVTDSGTVEIHVNDANLVEVLRMLSLQTQKNIIASKDVRGTITANLYDVTVKEALDAILQANGYAYTEKGNFIYVFTAKELAEREKASRVMISEVFRLYYTPATGAALMIKPALSAEAQVAATTAAMSGIETGAKDVGGNSHASDDVLVVTDYPENIEKVRKIVKEIDKRPQQILIEATILSAKLEDNNTLGVDFNIVGGVDFSGFTGASGQISDAITGTGTQALNGGAHSVGTGTNFSGKTDGFRVGWVTNNVSVFVSALETVADTTVLANPKVLALNKQRGEVIVGKKDGYITTTVTQTAQTQTVEFIETGTRLVFRPFIADDGFIRMEIHPEDSDGGVRTQGSAALPFKTTTEVTTNILIKDGRTVLIGGLFREAADINRSQVPFLGSLPLAGNLFRKQADHTKREEIIILLTPHIVKDDSAFAKVSEEQLKQAERARVGIRQGMMPWGRERLAESAYTAALKEMSKPTPDQKKAIWLLDCATNINPRFIEAMDLKQQLTGKEVSAVDNSSVRNFVSKLMLAEQAEPKTHSAVPATQPVAAPVAAVEPAPQAVEEKPQAVTDPEVVVFDDSEDMEPAEQTPAMTADVTVAQSDSSEEDEDWADADESDEMVIEEAEAPEVVAPALAVATTQPSQEAPKAPTTAVTELPADGE